MLELSINPFDAQLSSLFWSSPLDWIWGREKEQDEENCYFQLWRVDIDPQEIMLKKKNKKTFWAGRTVWCEGNENDLFGPGYI